MGDLAPREAFWPRLRGYLAAYVSWLVLTALSLWCFLRVRQVVGVALGVIGLGRWLPTTLFALIRILTIVLALIWLVAVVIMEAFLRKGAEEGLLWRRTLRVGVPVIAVLGLSYGVEYLLTGQVGFL